MTNSDVVIRVEGLGKKYSLHHEQSERYTALRDVWARQAKAAGRLLNPFTLAGQLRKAQHQAAQEHAASEEEFWALKDVSFEIRRGERVGIIGRNGAGKSTLLKILSRITEPTTGRVEIRGRVASLLEVGTGFHPELTGRENIYLNGAILGMTRREIRSKFDEIVDFAEVEKFLDTPVKRYSSGMYVRLAFAVAAHLEPEILIVDEVLAVGDADFQNKCLNNIRDKGKYDNGKTVLFVSHNLDHVRAFFDRGIYLEGGRIKTDGSATNIINAYRSSLSEEQSSNHIYHCERGANKHWSIIESACLRAADGSVCTTLFNSDPFNLEVVINTTGLASSSIKNFEIGFGILSMDGKWAFGCNNKHVATELPIIGSGKYVARFSSSFFPLYEDERFSVNLYCGWIDEDYIAIRNAFSFHSRTKISQKGVLAYDNRYCRVDMPGLAFCLVKDNEEDK